MLAPRWTQPSQLFFGAAALAIVALGAAVTPGCGSDVDSTERDPCDVDCEDANPCTVNSCEEGRCVARPVSDGTACSDDDACNGVEVCTAGACVGEPLVVNDGDVCTVDACDPTTGEITHGRSPGCFTWTALTSEGAPSARVRHTGVWTGTEMIVWGGQVDDDPSVTNTGAAYDPTTDSWRPISTTGAPAARSGHEAVWTGDRMLVWGGYGTSSFLNSGGIYDPASDSWSAMSAAGAPSGRTAFAAAWTGTQLVVHGGRGPDPFSNGALYELQSDTWSALPSVGLGGRFGHSATEVGGRVVIWGGTNLFDWLDDGAIWTSAATEPISGDGAPGIRQDHSATWTGSRLVVWGGWNGGPYLANGAMLDPSASGGGAWSTMSNAQAPSERTEHVALWTGTDVFIWGGCGADLCLELRADGGLFRPSDEGGTWYPIPPANELRARRDAVGVWTGEQVVVWGGRDASGVRGDGASAVIVPLR